MTQHMSAAQLRQQNNRDQAGRYSHGTLTAGIPNTGQFPAAFDTGNGQPSQLYTQLGHVVDSYDNGQVKLDDAIAECRRATGMTTMNAYNWIALSEGNDLSVYPSHTYSSYDDTGTLQAARTFTAEYAYGTCTLYVHHFEDGIAGPGSPQWVLDADLPSGSEWDNSIDDVYGLWEGNRPPSPNEIRDAIDQHYQYIGELNSGAMVGYEPGQRGAYDTTGASYNTPVEPSYDPSAYTDADRELLETGRKEAAAIFAEAGILPGQYTRDNKVA